MEEGTNPGFLYQQNTMRDAMIAGVTLNIFQNHADRVRMANLAQAVNVLQAVVLTNKEKIILTPTYHVLEMYNVHQDALLVPVSVKSDAFVVGKDSLEAVSVSASRDSNNLTHVSLVNIDNNKPRQLTIELDRAGYKSVSGRILSSRNIQDHNSFEQPDKVKPMVFTGASLKDKFLTITLPPASVVVLEIR